MTTAPVFIADPGALDGLETGQDFTLTGPEAHHAVKVQRIVTGQRIDIVDGAGLRAGGPVTALAPVTPALTITIDQVTREDEAIPAIVLVQALTKGGRDEQAVQSAIALGASAVIPWQAARSIAKWLPDKAAKGRERWRALVHAETKVARRAWLAGVGEPVTTPGLVQAITSGPLAGHTVLVLHEQATDKYADHINRLSRPKPKRGPIALVVGPEGGIAPEEIEVLAAAGAHPVRLGHNVLRAWVAGPAAIAAANLALGKW